MSNYIGPPVSQFEYNQRVSLEEGYSWRKLQKTKAKEVSDPVMVYSEDWEKHPEKLNKKLKHISDYLLLNPHPGFSYGNPNQPYLREVVAGKLRTKDYFAFDRLFGDEGPVETKDNHFFHSVKSALVGKVLQHPFQFASKQINTTFAQKKIVDNSTAGAKMAIQAVIAAGLAEGDGALKRFQDKKVKLPKDEFDLLDYQTGQEQVEGIMLNLLQHVDYQHSFQNISQKCYSDQFDVNMEFAWTRVQNGEVIPEYLSVDQVSWMANKRIETLEDPAVLAVGIEDFPTVSQLIHEEGFKLNTGTGVRSLLAYIEGLEKGYRLGYNPYDRRYRTGEWSEWFRSSDYNDDKYGREYVAKEVNWMNQCFYPHQRYGSQLLMSVLRHRFWFKVIRLERYKVLRDGRPATAKEYDLWQKKDYDRKINITFERVKDGESTKGHLIREDKRQELWTATRIGHDSFINIGRYEYQADKEGQSNYTGWPVVGQISYDKSFAKLGEQTAIRTNVLYNRADELMAHIGLTEAIIIDEDMGGDSDDVILYNAKKTGVLRIKSTRYRPNDLAQLKHLQTQKLGNHLEEMTSLLRAIREETVYWQSMIGISPQVQGQSERYAGLKETQLNISNQQVLTIKSTWQHTQFMNQLLTRCADIAKFAYAQDGYKAVVLTTAERKVLKLTKELALADFEIFLESGTDIQNQMEWIKQTAAQLAASGGAEYADLLFDVGTTQNPAYARALTRKVRAEIREAQENSAKAAQAEAQANREFEMQKLQIELEKQKMVSETAIRIQEMKMQDNREKADEKGTLADVKEVNDREKKIQDSALRQDEAEHQALLQTTEANG